MARTKVDNKLNVVIGTKAQIEGDTSIPENSIVVVTDEELKADEIAFSGSGTNYLTTETEVEGAIKELDTQVKANADGKLDKDTSVTDHAKVMVKSADGTSNSFALDVRQTYAPDTIVQRKNNSLISIVSGNTAARPTTNLNYGDLYFNTELGCLQVYDGTTWVSLDAVSVTTVSW